MISQIKGEARMLLEQTPRYNNRFQKMPLILGSSTWLRITSKLKMERINRNNIKPNNRCDIIEKRYINLIPLISLYVFNQHS